jgi:hypothetical protein
MQSGHVHHRALLADKSAVGAINRPQHCHPEHIRFTQCKLREGSVAMGREMLRCAQHDRAVTPTDGRIILVICIIGPLRPSHDHMHNLFRHGSIVKNSA